MNITIYRKSDGKIMGGGENSPSALEDIPEWVDFYLNCPGDATHIINNEPVVVAKTTDELLMDIRTMRTILLAESDFSQLEDSPANKQEWKVYRQKLRDLPATCNPHNPVYPEKPT